MATVTARRTARAPAAQPPLPDELLEDIFLRLDAAADLARASSACTSFRRVVSARRFLRRFRSLHHPPVLGILTDAYQEFEPAERPHRSAPAARALARAADFNFSFLPDPRRWRIIDARDGRLLLCLRALTNSFEGLVTCDPLHRRYVRIPPIPGDLTAGMSRLDGIPFLAPAGGCAEEEPSFRVIWMVQIRDKVTTFVFSPSTGEWCGGATFHGWRPGDFLFGSRRYYAHRCFYLTFEFLHDLLVLDARDMTISINHLPRHCQCRHKAIVEAGEGRIGLLTLGDGMLDLYCKTWPDNGRGLLTPASYSARMGPG